MLRPLAAQVCDFGLARFRTHASHVATSHTRAGTPGWMAPEVLRGEHFDEMSDLCAPAAPPPRDRPRDPLRDRIHDRPRDRPRDRVPRARRYGFGVVLWEMLTLEQVPAPPRAPRPAP